MSGRGLTQLGELEDVAELDDRSPATPLRPGEVALDLTDHRILSVLTENCRLSTRAIARHIGMSPSAVQERVSRLEAKGVVTGYHAAVDPEALGLGLYAIVGVQLRQGPGVSEMIEKIMEIPKVELVHNVTGRWDLLVEVRFENHHPLRDAIVAGLWDIPGLQRTETMLAIESFRRPENWLPRRLEAERSTPSQESQD